MNTKWKALNTKYLSFANEDTFAGGYIFHNGNQFKMSKALIVAHTVSDPLFPWTLIHFTFKQA